LIEVVNERKDEDIFMEFINEIYKEGRTPSDY
jgi:hypothetical protein